MKVVAFGKRRDGAAGALRHTWLARRLLPALRWKRQEWLDGPWEAPVPAVLAGVDMHLRRARELADGALERHSPARLVDEGPLEDLPEELKAVVRQAVHQCYVKTGVMQARAAELRGAADELEKTVAEVREAWLLTHHARRRVVLEEFLDKTEAAARRLLRALDCLPDGVILP